MVPVKFTGAHALDTPAFATAERTQTIFLLTRFHPIPGSVGVYAIGSSDTAPGAGIAYALLQSSSTTTGALRVMQSANTLETDNTDRVRLATINAPTAGATVTARLNGSETSISGTGQAVVAGDFFTLGNKTSGRAANTGAIMDVFAFGIVPSSLTRSNEQRMEGYLAWRAGLQSLLPVGHPYHDAPPMVPAGTTTTLGLFDVDFNTVGQSFMGGYIELQPDSFNGGTATPAIDGTTDVWGFPYSLTTSEKARLKAATFPGGGVGLKYIRLPLGFAYRGGRVVDGGSGLIKQIGERFSGQNAAIADLLSNVVAEGGGLAPEYWSPAPYWKTTSAYGNGTLWAGGSYDRSTTLHSIRTTDPTQFAAQIALLTDAMLNDLEYLHQNVAPVRMFGLQNEPDPGIAANYGSCYYETNTMLAVWKSLIPKIRGSSVLSTYGGQANTVLLHHNSWRGFDPASTGGVIVADTEVLSTGKTTLQEMWAGTIHDITNQAASAENVRGNAATFNGYAPSKPSFYNEREYQDVSAQNDQWRCANTMAWYAYDIRYQKSPVIMPIIHVSKQLGQTSAESNTVGYGLTQVRLPAPYGEDPATPGDPAPWIGYGQFDYVAPNWNAWRLIADNLPHGSTRRDISGTAPVSFGLTAMMKPNGKMVFFLVNRTGSPQTVSLDLASNRSLSGKRYDYQTIAAPIGSKSGSVASFTVPAYSGEAWTES